MTLPECQKEVRRSGLQEAVRDNILAGGTAVEEDFHFHMAIVRATPSPIFIQVAEAIEQYWFR
ncbi:hypothetical protein V3F56_11040 [Moorellaceae bacterium AZ2]